MQQRNWLHPACLLAGHRLLSTMLVKILTSEHKRRLKKARFEAWRTLVRAAIRRRRNLGSSMARIERRRLLRRIQPAFEFWKRLAFHKCAERAGVSSLRVCTVICSCHPGPRSLCILGSPERRYCHQRQANSLGPVRLARHEDM